MMQENSNQFSMEIRRRVYLLIVLVVVLAIVALCSILWQKQLSDQIHDRASEFHLASQSHYLKALGALRHVRSHFIIEQIKLDISNKAHLEIDDIYTGYSDSVLFYLISREIQSGLALQSKYADSRFASLSARIQHLLTNFEVASQQYQQQHIVNEKTISALTDLLLPLRQIELLHASAHDELMGQLQVQHIHQLQLFLLMLLILFLSGFLMVKRGLATINNIINAHDKAQLEIAKSEMNLKEAQKIAHMGSWSLNLLSEELSWSEEVYRIFEIDPEQFDATYEAFLEGIHPDDRERVKQTYSESVINKTPYNIEHRLLMNDGRIKHVKERGETFYDDKGDALRSFGTVQDISELKLLEETGSNLLNIIESARDFIAITSVEGNPIYINRAGREMVGFALDEDISELHVLDYHTPETTKLLQEQAIPMAIEQGEWSGESEFLTRDGGRILTSQTLVSHRSSSGEVEYFSTIARDITDIRQTEIALRKSQKMDAIGQLSGGIAHDFNNIIGIILGNINLLIRKKAADEKTQKRMESINRAAERAAVLTKQMLDFSRSEPVITREVSISDLIGDVQDLVTTSVTSQVEVELHLDAELWLTLIDPGDFTDALLNLILNARDAMEGQGRLTIETSNCTLDTSYCALNSGVVPGEYVQLIVSDTGTGIPKEIRERIFEPFFTTKEQGKGTGLGLSQVFGFVVRSHGHIKAYSEPDIGTTFRLYLPRSVSGQPVEKITMNKTGKLPVGSETILIVDDEQDLLEIVQETLQSQGYRVFSANNGEQALTLLTQQPAIEMLFSDVVMPGGINGFELAEQAIAKYPEIKVLLTSGYTERSVARNGQARFKANVLSKPYTQEDLLLRIHQVLSD